MAVAAPVLERKVSTEVNGYTKEVFRDNFMSDDERHNANIGYNYAKLINPESTLRDFVSKPAYEEEKLAPATAQEARKQSLYLVENARADADIFRADSIINRKTVEPVASEQSVVMQTEEENEDLVPTKTTIQYKTVGVTKSEEGKVEMKPRAKKTVLTKKDKIIVAVALTVIIALFVLIIVNSAVISGLNNELSMLQSTLTSAEDTYTQVIASKEAYFEDANLYQVVSGFAASNGMVLR